jgi:hypothetical protein
MLHACEFARAGTPQVIELDGPAGCGKSRIMQAFADTVLERYPDAMVLRGRCYEHESLPFKALDAMMDDLSRDCAVWGRLSSRCSRRRSQLWPGCSPLGAGGFNSQGDARAGANSRSY